MSATQERCRRHRETLAVSAMFVCFYVLLLPTDASSLQPSYEESFARTIRNSMEQLSKDVCARERCGAERGFKYYLCRSLECSRQAETNHMAADPNSYQSSFISTRSGDLDPVGHRFLPLHVSATKRDQEELGGYGGQEPLIPYHENDDGSNCIEACAGYSPGAAFEECAAAACLGVDSSSHVTKRWTTRVCLEAACKQFHFDRRDYYKCGKTRCGAKRGTV